MTSQVRTSMIEFIRLYRNLPVLWDVKSPEYTDRGKKGAAYDILVEKYKELEPCANRDLVRKKINSLRTNYRKEKRKVEEAITEGRASYTPSLWYYNELDFLQCNEPLSTFLLEDECSIQDFNGEMEESFEPMVKVARSNVDWRNRWYERPVPEVVLPPGDEEWDLVARCWASAMRRLPRAQQVMVKKTVWDVICQAELASLDKEITNNQPT